MDEPSYIEQYSNKSTNVSAFVFIRKCLSSWGLFS